MMASSELISVMGMHLSCRRETVHFSDFPRDDNLHNDIINPTRQEEM